MLFAILFIIVVLLLIFPIKVYSNLKTGVIINVNSTSKILFASYGSNVCTDYVRTAWAAGFISVSQLVVDNNYTGNKFLTIISIKSYSAKSWFIYYNLIKNIFFINQYLTNVIICYHFVNKS